jgi:hypothetical protein
MLKRLSIFFALFFLTACVQAQNEGGIDNIIRSGRNFGSITGGSSRSDTIAFEHRNDAKDSFTITYKSYDSLRSLPLVSLVNDFYSYFPIPYSLQYMGNTGSAGYRLRYAPVRRAGWDAGFHAFDAYTFSVENTRFFRTTKPYTQLGYQLASGKEQVIQILVTRNVKPNLNLTFEYRLINAPGFFVSQNTNHNGYRLSGSYQGRRKRYGAYGIFTGNGINSSENGGIANDTFLTTTTADYSRRFTIPVKLGAAPASDPNPFLTAVNTGNKYKDFTFLYRHYYDIGKKDSLIINDSTTEYLFYPRLRFQHTFQYNTQRYRYQDFAVRDSIYRTWYDTTLNNGDTLLVNDNWRKISNDFSLIQFPDAKNLSQFLLAGVRLENMLGTFSAGEARLYNLILHGEYRNKTRNRKWDLQARALFYLNGFNSGDYEGHAALTRLLDGRLGSLRLSFSNSNCSPAYLFNNNSSFNFTNSGGFKKENITRLEASAVNPYFQLSFNNYLIANHLFFANYRQPAQYGSLINLVQVTGSKTFKLGKYWRLFNETTLQQVDGAAPIRVPLLFTRTRIAYEGQFFRNLNLSTGIECRYYTAYRAPHYSPLMGQFVVQDSITLRNRPDVAAFAHFRIRTFTGYLRAENLNTVSFANGFGFTNNNIGAPQYLYPGLMIRFGIQWQFVN